MQSFYKKATLFCSLFILLHIYSFAQTVGFYIKSDGVEQYVKADPTTIKVLYWVIEVYSEHNSTKGPWGAIIGDSYESVLKQLKEDQQQDEEHAKLFNKSVKEYELNYSHPKGPIAIISNINKVLKSTASAKIVSEFDKANRRYSDYITAKQVFGIFDTQSDNKIYPDALFRDVGVTFKEYTDLLIDANKRLMSLGVTLNNFIDNGINKIDAEIYDYNQFLKNDCEPNAYNYKEKLNKYQATFYDLNSDNNSNANIGWSNQIFNYKTELGDDQTIKQTIEIKNNQIKIKFLYNSISSAPERSVNNRASFFSLKIDDIQDWQLQDRNSWSEETFVLIDFNRMVEGDYIEKDEVGYFYRILFLNESTAKEFANKLVELGIKGR